MCTLITYFALRALFLRSYLLTYLLTCQSAAHCSQTMSANAEHPVFWAFHRISCWLPTQYRRVPLYRMTPSVKVAASRLWLQHQQQQQQINKRYEGVSSCWCGIRQQVTGVVRNSSCFWVRDWVTGNHRLG